MRAQTRMTVVAPADHMQARQAVLATAGVPGPIYFRLGKDDALVVPGLDGAFGLGRIKCIRDGADAAIMAMGPIAVEALGAAELLAARGFDCAVAVVACLNPPPSDDLAMLLSGRRLAATVEVHYANGGLGSLVAEAVAERGMAVRLLRQWLRTMPDPLVGSHRYIERTCGPSAPQLAHATPQQPA